MFTLNDLTRFNKIAISNNKFQMASEVDKEAIGLSLIEWCRFSNQMLD